MNNDLQDQLEAKKDILKEDVERKIDDIHDDGFMDDAQYQRLKELLERSEDLSQLDQLTQNLQRENGLHNEYERIRASVMPHVERWFKYFVERLPREPSTEVDEDALTRQGAINRKAILRFRNLLMGTVKNPRVIRPNARPQFLASFVIDISGSMGGSGLDHAKHLVVFYSELFSMISKQFGYIRSSIYAFSDSLTMIKSFDQEYDSSRRYQYHDGGVSTVKARLMNCMVPTGGTNMLPALEYASAELTAQTRQYPDYMSALYFTGDGGDTCGNTGRIRSFMQNTDATKGFGRHIKSALFLGDESQRRILADLFGDENTAVGANLTQCINASMQQFDRHIRAYAKPFSG